MVDIHTLPLFDLRTRIHESMTQQYEVDTGSVPTFVLPQWVSSNGDGTSTITVAIRPLPREKEPGLEVREAFAYFAAIYDSAIRRDRRYPVSMPFAFVNRVNGSSITCFPYAPRVYVGPRDEKLPFIPVTLITQTDAWRGKKVGFDSNAVRLTPVAFERVYEILRDCARSGT